MKILALILFVVTYGFMIFQPKRRVYAAAAAAVIFLIAGIVPFRELLSVIDINVLLMLSGMMITVSYFIASGMPMKIADYLLDKSNNLCMVTVLLSVFAGLISAFIDNVATVLMIAPVALAIAKKQKVSPVPMVISIAVSSNLQGAATLVGDTTSILLGAYANMNFLDFFFMKGRPGIFWAVELGALLTIPVMYFLFRDLREPVSADENVTVSDYVPTAALVLTILTLIAASFFKDRPHMTNGLICAAFAIVCLIADMARYRNTVNLKTALSEYDYETVILLASLFVVVGGITKVGIVDDISHLFVRFGGSNLFLLYTLIVWGSVAVSAFIDNIPYVSAMLPVIAGICRLLNIEPHLLFFGLLTGATLGGNITPVGASANITGIGILRKQGFNVKNSDFMRISVPFTLVAVAVGYLFIWFVWK